MIPIQEIHPNPNQPRTHFNEKELGELSESIQEHGVLQPLLVRKDAKGYEIIAGERRYQAATLAGLTELPVIIKDVDDAEMLTIALIENLQRSDLNPIEEAKGYKQLIESSGMTQTALSKAVSKSRFAISNSLRLLDLPEPVQELIFDGSLLLVMPGLFLQFLMKMLELSWLKRLLQKVCRCVRQNILHHCFLSRKHRKPLVLLLRNRISVQQRCFARHSTQTFG